MDNREGMSLTPYNSPMSEQRADHLISRLGIDQSAKVLDAGCGSAAFLIRLLNATGCAGIGLDTEKAALNQGRESAKDLIQSGRLELSKSDLRQSHLEDARYAAAICMGSSHAFADEEHAFPVTLERLGKSVCADGKVLVGECYWRKQPQPDYLNLLGEPVGIYRTFEENILCGQNAGLKLVEAEQATFSEWDVFEQDHLRHAELASSNAPDDENLAASLKVKRDWYAGYEKWGRETLGFGFYLFQKV